MADLSRSPRGTGTKQAVDDVFLLQNRLEKLKVDEHRALKDLHRAEKRTQEILSARAARERYEEEKRRWRELREQELHAQQEAAHAAKQQRVKAKEAVQQQQRTARRLKVTQQRHEKEINECRVNIRKEEIRDIVAVRREEVRAHETEAKSRIEYITEKRLRSVRQKRAEDEEKAAYERQTYIMQAAELLRREEATKERMKALEEKRRAALEGLRELEEQSKSAAATPVRRTRPTPSGTPSSATAGNTPRKGGNESGQPLQQFTRSQHRTAQRPGGSKTQRKEAATSPMQPHRPPSPGAEALAPHAPNNS